VLATLDIANMDAVSAVVDLKIFEIAARSGVRGATSELKVLAMPAFGAFVEDLLDISHPPKTVKLYQSSECLYLGRARLHVVARGCGDGSAHAAPRCNIVGHVGVVKPPASGDSL
jgi:hypothetical protein